MRADARKHREELIEAARRVFARRGLHAPLQAVVEEAGVGRGTLYRHFGDRERLAVAVLERELSDSVEFVKARMGQPGFFREFICRHGLMAAIYSPTMQTMESLRQEGVADLLVTLERKVESLYADVVAGAVRSGEVRPSFEVMDLKLVVRMLVGASASHERSPEAAIEAAVDMILEGIRPR